MSDWGQINTVSFIGSLVGISLAEGLCSLVFAELSGNGLVSQPYMYISVCVHMFLYMP